MLGNLLFPPLQEDSSRKSFLAFFLPISSSSKYSTHFKVLICVSQWFCIKLKQRVHTKYC